MKRKLNLLLFGAIATWGISLAEDTQPTNKVTVTPTVKSTDKSKGWRILANEISDSQKKSQDAETKSLLSPLFKGVTYDAGACVITDCLPAKNTKGGGNFYGRVEYVSVTPHLSNNTFLFANDPGTNYDFNLEGVGTRRYEIGYRSSPCNLGFRARYWHYDQDFSAGGFFDNDAAAYIANDVGIDDVDSGNNVVATQEMEIDVLDLEATKTIGCNTLFGFGVRSAKFDQSFRANNIAVDDSNLASEMDFDGFGPTVSISTEHQVRPCIFVYGGVRGSLLFGEKRLSAVDGDGDSLFLTSEDDFASSIDADIGVRYQRGCLSLNAGLEAQYWIDVGSATPNAWDSTANSDPFAADIGFLGWKIGAGYDF